MKYFVASNLLDSMNNLVITVIQFKESFIYLLKTHETWLWSGFWIFYSFYKKMTDSI
jgi:hypothetical protein